MCGVNICLLCLYSKHFGQLQCILDKKQPQFFKILGQSEKGKQTSFFVRP